MSANPLKRSICRLMIVCGTIGLSPRPAHACMACLDHATQVRHPYVGALALVFAGWSLAMFILAGRLPRRDDGGYAFGAADAQALAAARRFAAVGFVTLVLGILFMNAHALGLLFVAAWLLWLIFHILAAILSDGKAVFRRSLFRAHVVALAAAGVAIPACIGYAHTPRERIRMLGNPMFNIASGVLIPGLIGDGAQAVPELKAALSRETAADGHGDPYRIAQIAFTLGRIGGDEARQSLRNAVAEIHEFDDSSSRRWQPAVLLAYAECGGVEAVDELKRVHGESAGEFADEQRAAALSALIRTGSAAGVVFALDHFDELREMSRRESSRDRLNDVALRSMQALIEGRTPVDLTHAPMFYALGLGVDDRTQASPSDRGFGHGISARDPQAKEALQSLEDRWREASTEIRRHWNDVLK